jgi:hypothetical protein
MRIIIFVIALFIFSLGVYYFVKDNTNATIACMIGVIAIFKLIDHEPKP